MDAARGGPAHTIRQPCPPAALNVGHEYPPRMDLLAKKGCRSGCDSQINDQVIPHVKRNHLLLCASDLRSLQYRLGITDQKIAESERCGVNRYLLGWMLFRSPGGNIVRTHPAGGGETACGNQCVIIDRER